MIGTRPEAIKMAPVVRALRERNARVRLITTGQHHLTPLLESLGLRADLETRCADGGLSTRTASMLGALAGHVRSDCTLVHGDTASALAGALASFQAQIPVAHVEAGLHTGDLAAPFPEEGHRLIIEQIASFWFAPTERAASHAIGRGANPARTWVTGNPGVDSVLRLGLGRQRGSYLVFTAHRRESLGQPLDAICAAAAELAKSQDVRWVLHPSPTVSRQVKKALRGSAVAVVDPLSFAPFVELIAGAELVLTDSGGVQEEATVLGVPNLVLRDVTDRPEAVQAGWSKVVGRATAAIVEAAKCGPFQGSSQPFGDGTAGERIATQLLGALRG